jgi:hypothetical protein
MITISHIFPTTIHHHSTTIIHSRPKLSNTYSIFIFDEFIEETLTTTTIIESFSQEFALWFLMGFTRSTSRYSSSSRKEMATGG